ncbi:hypothetical protein HanRHA438_Chr17g0794501 [Helianthus annuus]|nr:hypothetical protein HanRHA438_Chr17g0794501 [Helianthus annuus]
MFSGGRRYKVLFNMRGSSTVLIVYVATSSSSMKTAARVLKKLISRCYILLRTQSIIAYM